MNFWVGVASAEHVRLAVAGGFCQLCHGKQAALSLLKPGDGLVYYSLKEGMRGGKSLQAFTAIGKVQSGEVKQVALSPQFKPYRRAVTFHYCQYAAIRPLLDQLSFASGQGAWGVLFRRGAFEIEAADFSLIARAMQPMEHI